MKARKAPRGSRDARRTSADANGAGWGRSFSRQKDPTELAEAQALNPRIPRAPSVPEFDRALLGSDLPAPLYPTPPASRRSWPDNADEIALPGDSTVAKPSVRRSLRPIAPVVGALLLVLLVALVLEFVSR